MSFSTPSAVLVTGAARRLGREIALDLARAGFDIAVHYRGSREDAQATVDDIRALGRRAALLQADLAQESEARSLVRRAVAALGPLHALVNNASLFDYDEASSFTYARLDAHMHANLGAPVVLAHALHEATREGECACVVNLLDQKLWNPNPDFLSYSCSKFALEGATRMLALALAPRVRVVGVAPGVTLVSGDMSEAGLAEARTRTPLGRSSMPEDIAHAVRFAITNPAVTGTTLIVDGGQHCWPSERDVMFKTSVR
ncbi:MAG TPA: SDR family oxidoreductase [Burkholderiaceae bacterium]|nr:SDR family oxidoreductase [Burkholderiaceae bacterium]